MMQRLTWHVIRHRATALADAVLAARADHPTASLAILYDLLTMPADLRRAWRASRSRRGWRPTATGSSICSGVTRR